MPATDRTLLAGIGGALVLAATAAWLLLAPGEAAEDPALTGALPAPSSVGSEHAMHTPPSELVVDVEGGVARPGVQQLPAGARVADAIAAAGGYAPHADLAAAAARINLAQPLSDGEQIYVPTVDDAAAGPGATAGLTGDGGDAGSDAPVDLNTATPEQLEALPGIGPVTVDKILAARAEQPFTSLDDAVSRGVINRGQLEKIQDLATAG